MKYSIKPYEYELRKARKLVEEALKASKTFQEKEKDLKVSLAWIEDDFTKERLKGVFARALSRDEIEINFNSDAEDWENGMLIFSAHEYAHTIFYEQKGIEAEGLEFNWQHILLEAHSQHFSEKVYPEKEAPWRKSVNREEFSEKWPEIKDRFSKEIAQEPIIDCEELPLFFGYSLAYRIGEKLLEKHELEEFAGLERSDLIYAGDNLFS